MMARLASLLGALLSVGFMVVTAIMNWRYGQSLGRSDIDQWLFAAVSGGIDAMKVLAPFFLWWSLANRRFLPALLSAIVLVACMTYSVAGIAGYVDLNRATTTGTMSAKRDTADGLKAELARKEAQLAALGTVTPAGVTEEKLAGLRQDKRWQASAECSDATAKTSREFCIQYQALAAEKAKAAAATGLEADIAALRDSLNGLAGVAAVDRGDARAGFWSRVTGFEVLEVQTLLAALLVGTVEFISTFGMFFSLNHGEIGRTYAVWRDRRKTSAEPAPTMPAKAAPAARLVIEKRPAQRDRVPEKAVPPAAPAVPRAVVEDRRPAGDVARFTLECLRPAPGTKVPLAALYPRYREWCAGIDCRPLAEAAFLATFVKMSEMAGLPIEGEGAGVACRDVRLAA